MIETIALILLFANPPAEVTTLPRQRDANPVADRPVQQEQPTDPLFARPLTATDDPAFVLGAIESARQGAMDARDAEQAVANAGLRDAAVKIARQNELTRDRLETLAKRKGWRLPADNPARASTLPASSAARTGANFIITQISSHESTVAQYRAQLAGHGDAELKRALRQTLPGFEKNLDLLLRLKL
ncbi:MAG TPA: DUF4142 domain-containing protein [Steroidobacteraceae bacterium]|jgi:hypothetical protein|nr:DUF4142 domain-containing protein [Steroidobacteraceae bacterium]